MKPIKSEPQRTERERVCAACRVGDHNGCEAACIDGFCCCADLDTPTEPQRPAPESQPPARVWIESFDHYATDFESFNVATEYPGEGFIEYAHLEPIKNALEACEANGERNYMGTHIRVRKLDWDALVALVKEEK
jgi:hypothetical protein